MELLKIVVRPGCAREWHGRADESPRKNWVAVKELHLSYHNPETIWLTISPYYGNLSYHNMEI